MFEKDRCNLHIHCNRCNTRRSISSIILPMVVVIVFMTMTALIEVVAHATVVDVGNIVTVTTDETNNHIDNHAAGVSDVIIEQSRQECVISDEATAASTATTNGRSCPVGDEVPSIDKTPLDGDAPAKSNTSNEKEQSQCGLYIAKSTIPGAGLGAFTGIDRNKGDHIGYGDVMVPIYDVQYHLQALGTRYIQQHERDWDYIDPTRDYVWYGSDVGMQYESADVNEHISGIAYGLDAAINCHLALYNANKLHTSYDFVQLHRSKDPGIGAFTPYFNASTVATQTIKAGSELFKSYGDEWFIDRTSSFGLVPLMKDYKTVETMLKKLNTLFEYGNISIDIRKDFYYNNILTNPYYNTTRTLLAIPKKFEDYEYIVHHTIRDYYQQSATRTIEELEMSGRCVDTIRPKPSSLRQAGRGAYTTRSFKNNSIVIGTPMFFYPTNDYFKIYNGNWISKSISEFRPKEHIGYQLMYNYCWAHEYNISSILLCPYGMNVNYINHNQSLANVRVQWAQKDGDMNHNSTLLRTHPSAMYKSDAPKLWLDFIATRDIDYDEEIFIDYGTVWEQKWNDHVNRWNRNHEYPTDYVSAYDWNSINGKVMLRTILEQETDPYPEHFTMICLPQISDIEYTEILTSDMCERLWKSNVVGTPCRIVDRKEQPDGSFWYHVWYQNTKDTIVVNEDPKIWVEVQDWIVREAIRFVNKPYTNDIFLKDAFRQPIGIPDDIFPDAWRNVYLSALPPLTKKQYRYKRKQNEKKNSIYTSTIKNTWFFTWISKFFPSML